MPREFGVTPSVQRAQRKDAVRAFATDTASPWAVLYYLRTYLVSPTILLTLLLPLTACGPTTFGLDVPLTRDCTAESAALRPCDVAEPACYGEVARAVACFAGRDPARPLPELVRGLDPVAELPAAQLDAEVLDALVVLRVSGATLARGGYFEPVVSPVSAYGAPLRVLLSPDLSLSDTRGWMRATAAGVGWALALEERPMSARLETSRGDVERRFGDHAVLLGRGALYASFVDAALDDTTAWETWWAAGHPSDGGRGLEGWIEDLADTGGGTLLQVFLAGGDPSLQAWAEASVEYDWVRSWYNEPLGRYLERRPPALDVAALALEPGHRVVSSFVGGAAFGQLAMGQQLNEPQRSRVWHLRSGAGDVIVWVVETDRAWELERLGLVMAERGLQHQQRVRPPWVVSAVATTTTASTAAMLDELLERLP